jgi:hypothetical protein
MPDMTSEEARRGARVTTSFLVAIEGLDGEPALRKGDISATGAYFETDYDVGGVGTIHWLHLVAADGTRTLHVMAYVARTLQMVGAGGKRVGGAAFEFMPDNDEAATALREFVRYVLGLRHGDVPHIEPRLDASMTSDARDATDAGVDALDRAVVQKLSVRSMVLETSWAIAPGERVRVDITAPGMTRRIRLEGRAVRVSPKDGGATPSRYDIEVEVQEETRRPLRTHSSMTFQAVAPQLIQAAKEAARASQRPSRAPSLTPSMIPGEDEASRTLDDLLSALILPPEKDAPRQRHHHLSGQLSRIRLPTLLSLFDMERMTGKLVLRRDIEEARIWLRDGQLFDVEPIADGESRRARVASLLAWEDGAFEFYDQPVERANRVGASTTAVLLDLARETDEARRDASST